MILKKMILSSSIALFSISVPITAATTTSVSAATKKVKLTKEQKSMEKEIKKIKSSAKSGKAYGLKTSLGQTYQKFSKANKNKFAIVKNRPDHSLITMNQEKYTVYFNGQLELNPKVTYLTSTQSSSKFTVKELNRVLGEPKLVRLNFFGDQTIYSYVVGKNLLEFVFEKAPVDSSQVQRFTVSKRTDGSFYHNSTF